MESNELMTDDYAEPILAENGNIIFTPSTGGQIITPTDDAEA